MTKPEPVIDTSATLKNNQLAQDGFITLWQAYCDKKSECEDLIAERDAAKAELAKVVADSTANGRLRAELAKLRERFERAPVVMVRGKVGEFATIVVSHDLTGKRVRLVVEDGGDA